MYFVSEFSSSRRTASCITHKGWCKQGFLTKNCCSCSPIANNVIDGIREMPPTRSTRVAKQGEGVQLATPDIAHRETSPPSSASPVVNPNVTDTLWTGLLVAASGSEMHAGTQVVNPVTSSPTKETKSISNLKEAPWKDEQSLSFIENFNAFPTNGKSRNKKFEAFLNHDSSLELRQLRLESLSNLSVVNWTV